ncbi:MAG: glycosyltransferase family 4 protein [Propionivibrio sp.]|uniref:glycosyltransferase family 4 protein n=1 Tax=Propionivibrio sp. TaxID=2212460 RepID=UPI001A4F00E6|nr:glycosyltransferase family 4 protein [Propionivibrio sp.]MBL8414917.1 glycosyltransferase family 4 protein [Propionivibrio sp.]
MNVQTMHSVMDPIRVLLVSPAPRAGTVQYAHNLASHLGRRGHRVSLLTGVGYELAAYARDYTPIEAIDRFRPRPVRMWQLWRHLRELRPQIIHYQGGQHPDMFLLLDMLLRKRRETLAVYTPQDLHSNSRRAHHDAAARSLLGRMSYLFFNSEDNRAFVRDHWRLDVSQSSVKPVPDLMDFMRQDVCPEPPAVPNERRLLLCFGLIEPRKGIGSLLEAFALLRKQCPDAHLAVVGKALMDTAPLHEAIERHGMASHVELVAQYVSFERMAGYFERAECVVLPYEAGWNSGVIPVAYGYRKPVVATTVAGAGEVVRDGQTGLLVPPADPGALAAALQRILDEPALRDTMQPHLEQAANDCGWQSLVDETESVYRRLLGG